MNLVTILIPVLLVAIKSLELVVIDTTLPAMSTAPATTDDKPDKPPLSLSMALTNTGIRLIGADNYLYPAGAPPAGDAGSAPPTVPCKSQGKCRGIDDYDWGDLRRKLTMIKDAAQNEERDSDNVILVPESSIRYEIIVKAMDTSRDNPDIKDGEKAKKLFPNVVIAGGAN
jgi:hypothetical protein